MTSTAVLGNLRPSRITRRRWPAMRRRLADDRGREYRDEASVIDSFRRTET
jgi:hypothetical protein